MDTLSINETGILQQEQVFYFSPVFTTIIFFGSVFYACFLGICFIIAAQIISGYFLIIPVLAFVLNLFFLIKTKRAFVRMVMQKPSMKLTPEIFYDYWNNKETSWSNITDVSSYYRWWNFINVSDFSYWVISETPKNTFNYWLRVVDKFLSKQKLKVPLFIIKGKNEFINSSIKTHTRIK